MTSVPDQSRRFPTGADAIHAPSSWIDTALGQSPPVAFEHRIITVAVQAA